LKTDTNGLLRTTNKADLEAFNHLFPKIAPKTLSSIENPRIPKSYFLKFADGINNSIQYGDMIISQMGRLHNPDIAAEMADFLLRMENIHWSLCIGEYRDDLVLSVRTSRKGRWAGRVVLRVLRGLGKGGGHEKAAGGRVSLAGLQPESRQELTDKIIESVHKNRRIAPAKGTPAPRHGSLSLFFISFTPINTIHNRIRKLFLREIT
jgi:nanoRNase/pAp phosphatase (c-di-AMP/oligoRNAs hydrolase)